MVAQRYEVRPLTEWALVGTYSEGTAQRVADDLRRAGVAVRVTAAGELRRVWRRKG